MQRAFTRHDPITDLPPSTCAVVDLDNVLHRGLERPLSLARPQGHLNLLSFSQALRHRGVVAATVCRNKPLTQIADQIWRHLGFKLVYAGRNCDAWVSLAAITYVEAGCRDLILVSGDGDYADHIRLIQACGVRVEIWSRKHNLSSRLRAAANAVRYIDRLLLPPRRSIHPTLSITPA